MNIKNIFLTLSLFYFYNNIIYLSSNLVILFFYNREYIQNKIIEGKNIFTVLLLYPQIIKNYMNSINLLIVNQDNYIESMNQNFNTSKEFSNINEISNYLDNL